MQVKSSTNGFQPFKMELVIETEAEFLELFHRLNTPLDVIVKEQQEHLFRPITNPSKALLRDVWQELEGWHKEFYTEVTVAEEQP